MTAPQTLRLYTEDQAEAAIVASADRPPDIGGLLRDLAGLVYAGRRPAKRPTSHPPGTALKLAVMRQRASRREDVFHPLDATGSAKTCDRTVNGVDMPAHTEAVDERWGWMRAEEEEEVIEQQEWDSYDEIARSYLYREPTLESQPRKAG